MYQAVLADATFHEQLLVFDRDLAASARAARCWLCGGVLHAASYDRKPRGCPAGLAQEYAQRFSFCCAVDGCRKRTTPPSLRFLGRHVYLATVVTLISALMLGTIAELQELQDEYQAWLDALPQNIADSATAEALRAICDLELSELESIVPPRGFGRD